MKLKYYLRGLGIGIVFTALFCGLGKNSANEPMSDSEIIARAKELGMVEGTVLSNQGEINAQYTAQLNENGQLVLETTPIVEETVSDEESSSFVEETETLEETAIIEETVSMEETATTEETTSMEETSSVEETEESAFAELEETSTSEEILSSEESKVAEIESSEETILKETSTDSSLETIEESKPLEETQGMVAITVTSGSGSETVARSCEQAGLVASALDFDAYLCANGYATRICVGTFEIPAASDYETIAKIITRTR